MVEPVLAAKGVTVRFDLDDRQIQAVRGVDIDVFPGEIVALVGESGSGKSAFAKSILRLYAPPFVSQRARVGGSIRIATRGGWVELVGADDSVVQNVRAAHVAMVSQDALSGLNPVIRIDHQVAEALRISGRAEHDVDPIAALLTQVGLADTDRIRSAFAHQLSGGQRQRVIIALALARSPRLLIADEPTTALDVTVQAKILRLLEERRASAGTSILFITHDLDVVGAIADRAAVFYAGQVVEIGSTERIFTDPRHPYTNALLASRPSARDGGARLKGTAPDPAAIPKGCPFRPRCAIAADVCKAAPPVFPTEDGFIRCWKAAV